MDKVDDLYARRLARESKAREEAERLLEQKSLELFLEMEERQRALDALRESEERYRLIVELSPDAILIESGGRIVFANNAAKKLFRETEQTRLLDHSLLDLTTSDCRDMVEQSIAQSRLNNVSTYAEETARRLDGTTFEVSVRRVALTYGGQAATQTVARDISDRKKLERQLAYQATHDSLTGAINRDSLLDRLSDAIAYADRHGFPVWVAFVDIDRFKQVNDRFGHAAGDQLLQVITDRLANSLRKDDVLGRYGGDEFVLVLRGGPEDHLTTQVIERLMASVCEPVSVDDHELRVTCSIGVATYPVDGNTPEEMMQHADAAMYMAKESGRNLCQFYNSEINEQLQLRARIESELMHALARSELYLVYQPQISLKTGQIEGAEALLRWASPVLGELTPDQFIPLAEQTTLINQIGEWVVREAAQQAADWERDGAGALRIAVNLSARQLNGLELLRIVKTALADSGLPPQRLELELTESLMMSDVKLTLDTLHELHRMGVQVAVDDFGTGYSSLVYLQRLPLNCLKIDREFVRALSNPEDRNAVQIISTLIRLAHSLKLRVVAEGVENRVQLDVLREHGCDEIQGYLHSAPQRANGIPGLLRSHSRNDWV
jgi:diguanylate cyclase (GGDEF)-like protein/PAS domain S-box-containing protein